MAKPKILIIENSTDITGALHSITRSCVHLRNNFEFIFAVPANSKSRKLLFELGFELVYEVPFREVSRNMLSNIFYVPSLLLNSFRIRRIIKNEKPILIHVNDIYNLIPPVLRMMNLAPAYICHVRFVPDRFPVWLFNSWYALHSRFAEKIIAVSQVVLSQLKSNPKNELIYNELPLHARFPLLTKEMDRKHHVFLYLANYIRGKGQNYALEAFARIHNDLPNWKVRFVGGDMGIDKNRIYKSELVELTKKLNILSKTEWIEFTDEVEKEYRLADIVLNFSESESFSLTCLEALYFGKPLIATNSGGPAEIVENEKDGILIPNKSVHAMAEAMKLLASDKHLCEVLSSSGRQKVLSKFSVENTTNKLKALYYDVIKQNYQ